MEQPKVRWKFCWVGPADLSNLRRSLVGPEVDWILLRVPAISRTRPRAFPYLKVALDMDSVPSPLAVSAITCYYVSDRVSCVDRRLQPPLKRLQPKRKVVYSGRAGL